MFDALCAESHRRSDQQPQLSGQRLSDFNYSEQVVLALLCDGTENLCVVKDEPTRRAWTGVTSRYGLRMVEESRCVQLLVVARGSCVVAKLWLDLEIYHALPTCLKIRANMINYKVDAHYCDVFTLLCRCQARRTIHDTRPLNV